jgi:glycogen synthase
MRVLTVTNLYPPDVIGGYEIACRQMVQALRERGHEVRVLASWPRRPVPPEPGVERTLRMASWHIRPYREPVTPELEVTMDVQAFVVDSTNAGVLLRELESFQPDLVYLWNTTFLGPLALCAVLAHLQVPIVWHLMDAVPRAMVTVGGLAVPSVARLMSRRMRARYLVCSQRLLDEISGGGFEFGDSVRIVPNWAVPPKRAVERDWFPDSTARLRMVFAGQLAPHKGIELTLDAASILLSRGCSQFQIDLFGTGLDSRYQRQIIDSRLEDHVRLLGALDHEEVVERFWNYDLFLFPTWEREPFAFAPLEAAVRGCVPVISRDCGNAEWCVDGVHAIKVKRDAFSLADAIESVLVGRTNVRAIARRSEFVTTSWFSLERAADMVEEAMSDVQKIPAERPGQPEDAYHLARLAERLALDWAERPR